MATKEKKPVVLVPVDFSVYSEAAVLFAARLAKCLDLPLMLLHVVHDPGELPGYYYQSLKQKQVQRIEDRAQVMLDEFLQRLIDAHEELTGGRRLQASLVKGIPVTRILEVAAKENAGHIVLGSKGATGLKHLMLGSVAERVVRLSKVPVTVVKAEA
jgi:nucleotide-binding universal stress UspA family protein